MKECKKLVQKSSENHIKKDDYNLITYKVLAYLYGVFKRVITFDDVVFVELMHLGEINKRYFIDILRYLQMEGYIQGLSFTKAWANEYILISDYSDMVITHKGIQYLLENNSMKQIKEILIDNVGLINSLIKIIF